MVSTGGPWRHLALLLVASMSVGTVGAAVRFGLLIITTKKLPSLTPVSASVCSSFSTLPA